MGTEIERYCLQNDIAPQTKYLIRLAFEELAAHILAPVLEHTPLLITIEYSGKDGSTEVRALYNGEKYDPAESEDDIYYKVLSGACNSMSYHYDPEAEYANTVRVLM